MVEKSIQIKNKDEYTFRLKLDDIKGIIRLTKNKTNNKQTRITDRNIPINASRKWFFHRQRTGYSDKLGDYNFIGSYIDRAKDPNMYQKWKNYIISTYKELKSKEIEKC